VANIRLKSEVGGRGQLFFAMPNFTAENAAGFDAGGAVDRRGRAVAVAGAAGHLAD